VEYLADSTNAVFAMPQAPADAGDATSLLTFTATVDLKPIPDSTALVLRPEFRYESASEDYFLDRDGKATSGYYVLALGAVVTTM
jgi:hypothetical protein